ncbi:YktB family protein [Effusibacillus lacus]|uniref:UPF0637 protein EFBL_2992 n=1 Tax=Effusibacillus lacus TaxID=1348429 RepID=A0A292YQ61_9BACL|nr:DUF1054 domain-containing protein [Effusibacillus lacus]TCS76999.1 uncharacterized protein YktB (UPF0637 family) [Effusibacillus lacus]GAX91326.1 hypothetical protein EFBL_2992 [Effusibacillus lacus]
MFAGWKEEDFAVFEVEGLEPRMEALKTRVRPKFEAIGTELAPDLSAHYGEEFFAHVAKHARRKTNPPSDSWVSFATNPRGYKMLPHFQVGLWSTHAFVQFAIIYECLHKKEFGEQLARQWPEVRDKIPGSMLWYDDHVKPKPVPHSEMNEKIDIFTRKLIHNKNGELLVGIEIPRAEAISMSGGEFLDRARQTMLQLEPLYKLSPQ